MVYNYIKKCKRSDFMGRPPAIPYDEIPKMKFGRLKPIRMIYGKDRVRWLCKCDCGNETIVTQKNLCNGNTKSCGCLSVDMAKSRNKGYRKNERLYVLLEGMKGRCNNPKNTSYKWYGAKGIKVCREWEEDYLSFKKWAIDNGYDETLPRGAQTIDRIDYNGDYSPENCRWVTIREQQRNKASNTPYELNGESHLLCEWAEILGFDYNLLRSRVVSYGWTLEQALEKPVNSKKQSVELTYQGQTKTAKEWSKILGIKYHLIMARLYRGLPIEDVFYKGDLDPRRNKK